MNYVVQSVVLMLFYQYSGIASTRDSYQLGLPVLMRLSDY